MGGGHADGSSFSSRVRRDSQTKPTYKLFWFLSFLVNINDRVKVCAFTCKIKQLLAAPPKSKCQT